MLLTINYGGINKGYIAGASNGIVTAAGKPVSRTVVLLNAESLVFERATTSLQNGHYMFMDLSLTKKYLVMVRDYKKEYEPFVWDDVTAADDLTIDEQMALQASWQT